MKKNNKNDLLMMAGAIAVGGIVAGIVPAAIKKVTANLPFQIPGFIPPLLPLGVGIILANNKNKNLQGVGFGMIAVGGRNLAGFVIPALAGPSENDTVSVFLDENINSPADMSVLSNPADMAILSSPADMSVLSEADGVMSVEEQLMYRNFNS
jgi:hypothetical protein